MTVDAGALLAAVRAGFRPPAAALVCLIAAAQLEDQDAGPTVPAMMELTGYSRSAVFRARAWLDEYVPEWRTEPEPDTPYQDTELQNQQLPEAPAPAKRKRAPKKEPEVEPEVEPAGPVEVSPALDLEPHEPTGTGPSLAALAVQSSASPAVVTETPAGPPPAWKLALAERSIAMRGRRSWDLYADVYGPAADELYHGNGEGLGELIALTCDYVEAATGDEVDTAARKRVAQLVRRHGKAAMYGLHEAIPRVEDLTVHNLTRYATSVAARTAYTIRQDQAEGAAT